jgi:uncharacterized protein YndB with AHSA1/START domain
MVCLIKITLNYWRHANDGFRDREDWLNKAPSIWSRRLDALEREQPAEDEPNESKQTKNFLMKTNEQHGKFTNSGEVRFAHILPGSIERVWNYLTDSEKRARWFGGGVLEQKVGGKVEFVMVHKNLAPNETPPAKYAQVQDPGVTFEGRVLRCEPPRLLVYTFGSDDSEVTFELTPQDKHVLLVLTHRTQGNEERAELTNYAAGWHTHLAHLVAELEGTPRPKFWAMHAKLLAEYEKLQPLAAQS